MRLLIQRITDYYKPQITKVCFKQAYKIFADMFNRKDISCGFCLLWIWDSFLVHIDICFENIN